MKNKRIAVIGGAGFIGSHLVDALVEEGAKILVIDDLFLGRKDNIPLDKVFFVQTGACDYNNLWYWLDKYEIEIVYNLAVLPLPHSLDNPYVNIEVNIKIVQNLCKILQNKVFKKFIHFSSSEVYGSAQYEPMCEAHPIEPSTPYAASKAAGDFICMSYVKTFGCDISIIRPFNNYGPRQNAGSYAGVIPLTIERIKNGQSPIIYGDGQQTRDYIYVEDTARAAVMMGKRDDLKGQIINIGSGHDVSIQWLVEEIMTLMRLQGFERNYPIRVESARPGDVRRHIANIFKAKDVLGFEHKIGMEEGLRKTIDWYLRQI